MSKAIKKFNGLNGTVGAEEVKKIAILAAKEGQTTLARRLEAALQEAKKHNTVIFNPGPLALEEVPSCDLPGLDYIPPYISAEDFTGLNKAVSPDDIYQYITDLMINTIKKVGSLPWERNWEKTGLSNGKEATNYESKKGYRGINFFLLNFEVKEDEEGEKYLDIKNWENPYFLTFKQIEKFGGKLTKGSTGHRVVYFTKLYSHSETKKDGTKTEFATYNQKKFLSWIEKNKNNLEILTRSGWTVERLANSYIPILKYYNVFNAGDITGIEWEGIPKNENSQKTEQEKIDIAEAIIKNYPNPPKIIFGGDQPHYNINKDTVVQTPLSDFKNPQGYYSVLFHELIHSTGAEKRLARTFGKTKNDPQYAKEELIAEMGAVFLCAESGILFRIIDNSAAYLKGWNSRLIKNMEEDNRFYFRAASASQAAADHILDRDKNGVPAYQKISTKKDDKKENTTNKTKHEGWQHRVFIIHNDDTPATVFEFLTKAEAEKLYHEYLKKPNSEIVTWDKIFYDENGKTKDNVTVQMTAGISEKKKNEAEKPKEENYSNYTVEKFSNDLPPYKTIEQSYRGISFSSEKRAENEIKEWGNVMHETFTVFLGKAKKQGKVTEFMETFDKLYPRLLKRKIDIISKRSGLLSTMITGPSGFPVRSQQKKSGYYDNAMREYIKYSDYFDAQLNGVIYNTAVIRSGESDTIQKLREKLEKKQEQHELMKLVNKASKEYQKHKDIKKLEKYDFKPSLIETITKVDKNGKPFPGFYLTNSNAEIKRLKDRISQEEKRAKTYEGGSKTTEKKDYKILENIEENRLQLIFDGKPTEEVRKVLKKHGFRWSPKNSAWQRQLTNNAKYIVNKFVVPALEANGLNAPWHEGMAKEALSDCGRLLPGYKYQDGNIVKVETSKKKKPTAGTSKKEAEATPKKTVVAKEEKTGPKTGKDFPLILEFPIDEIHIDTARFQNRSKLNENTVNNIVENFTATQFDPVILWTDPKNNKTYLLAGHHRLEAYKRLYKDNIPAKFANKDYPTEAEAIIYARQLSNANRTLEMPIERAKIYREMTNAGETSKAIDKASKIEGKNQSYILNLAALNDRGRVIEALERLADTPDKQNEKALEKMADWIGEARRKYPQLTNAHETEMFKFLNDASASKRIKTKSDFLQKIYSLAGTFDFDDTVPLNLNRIKYESAGEKAYNEDFAEMKKNISDKLDAIQSIKARFSDPSRTDYESPSKKDYKEVKAAADDKISHLNTEIGRIQKRMIELQQNKGKYTKAGQEQGALFGPKSKKSVPKKSKSVPKKRKSGLKGATIEPKTTAGGQSIGGSSRPLLSGKKTLKASDIANMSFETLPLDEGWENLFQQAPKNMRIATWALPKNGKTAACCAFASYLTKFGPILYNFADQGINLSTKNLIAMSGLDKKSNAYITTGDTIDELVRDIEATGAQHVVIDMINQYINNGVTPHTFKKEVLQRFPDVGFNLVMETTKEGNFKGDQSWTHLVDQLVTIDNYIMDTKGRYGTGEKISWEEGAQKYSPQRYAEIKGKEVEAAVPAEKEIVASTPENEEVYNFLVY